MSGSHNYYEIVNIKWPGIDCACSLVMLSHNKCQSRGPGAELTFAEWPRVSGQ